MKAIKLVCTVSVMENDEGFTRFCVSFDSDDHDPKYSLGNSSNGSLRKAAGDALSDALASITLKGEP